MNGSSHFKELNAFIFKDQAVQEGFLTLKIKKVICSFKMSESTHPITQHHTPFTPQSQDNSYLACYDIPHITEYKVSLECSQQAVIGTWLETDKSSPCPSTFLSDPFHCFLPSLPKTSRLYTSFMFCPPKPCTHFFSLPCMPKVLSASPS